MQMKTQLSHTCEVSVRFNEVDSLGIVWHGHYVKFFEDGREAFGRAFGLGYLDVYNSGFATPIVSLNLDYKKTVAYGDSVLIETTFINTPAAKIIFEYKIYRKSDMELVATGKTIQVFVTLDYQLYITVPEFLNHWKQKHLGQ